MKKFFVGSLWFLVIGLGACRKKQDCTYKVHKTQPTFVLFSGFIENEIDTLIVTYSDANSDTILNVDTVVSRPILKDGNLWPDTIFDKGFATIKVGEKVDIKGASPDGTFSITCSKEEVVEYVVQKEHCGVSGPMLTPPDDIRVNGVIVKPQSLSEISYNHYIIISK